MLLPYKPFVLQIKNILFSFEVKKTFLGFFKCSCQKDVYKDYNEYLDEKIILNKENVISCDFNELNNFYDVQLETIDYIRNIENDTKTIIDNIINLKDNSESIFIKKDEIDYSQMLNKSNLIIFKDDKSYINRSNKEVNKQILEEIKVKDNIEKRNYERGRRRNSDEHRVNSEVDKSLYISNSLKTSKLKNINDLLKKEMVKNDEKIIYELNKNESEASSSNLNPKNFLMNNFMVKKESLEKFNNINNENDHDSDSQTSISKNKKLGLK